MTEEASVPVLILCQPESEVAEVIRKRLEQKGVPFCILPVGSHFAPPRIPDTCGVVLIPLCRELVQIPLSDTLHQLQQAGATLLPLGREDAAPLWKALTAGAEESIAQQKVFQLEDLWEKQLPIPTEEDESAPLLPILPQPKVNRKAPTLNAPLVDLNIPDLPPPPPIRFTSSPAAPPTPAPSASPTAGGDTSTLKGWILLFLFPTLAVLALVVWNLFSTEETQESRIIIQTTPYTSPPPEQEKQVASPNESPAGGKEEQPSPDPLQKKDQHQPDKEGNPNGGEVKTVSVNSGNGTNYNHAPFPDYVTAQSDNTHTSSESSPAGQGGTSPNGDKKNTGTNPESQPHKAKEKNSKQPISLSKGETTVQKEEGKLHPENETCRYCQNGPKYYADASKSAINKPNTISYKLNIGAQSCPNCARWLRQLKRK